MRHRVRDLISLCHDVFICKLGLDHAPTFRAHGEGHVCESVAGVAQWLAHIQTAVLAVMLWCD